MQAVDDLPFIVGRARQGDTAAFTSLVERFQDMAVGYAWSMVGDFHLAQDAAQEAFIQAYVNLQRLRSDEAFAGWFRRIVHSSCTRIIRRKADSLVPVESLAVPGGDEPHSELERREISRQLRGAIMGLAEDQRAVLVLYHIVLLASRQIATFLGVSEPAVTYRLHAARKRVRKDLRGMVEDNVRNIRVSGTGDFARKVVEGVPKIGFYAGESDCPEDIALPAVLRTCFRWLGEDYGFRMIKAHGQNWKLDRGYTLFAGLSGTAFRFLWGRNETWRVGGDGLDAAYLRADPARSLELPFAAAGYGYQVFVREDFAALATAGVGRLRDEAHARELVMASVDQDRPLIALGVVGPPEPCIVTGYDDGGAAVIGWSYFQDPSWDSPGVDFEPSGYFRRRGWFADTAGLVIVGERCERMPPDDVYRAAFAMGARLMRTPFVSGYPAGLKALEAWAADLSDDGLFVAGDAEALTRGFGFVEPWIWDLAERRWYGAMFARQAAEEMAGLGAGLEKLADCLHSVHDMMWEIAGLFPKKEGSSEHLERLADPAVRRQAARIILCVRDRDRQAAGLMDDLARRS